MLNQLLIEKPIFTEKTERLKSDGSYTFKVSKRANKIEIKKIIEDLYKADVISVKIINIPQKSIIRAGKNGIKPGYKKAIVKLKEGQKIENI